MTPLHCDFCNAPGPVASFKGDEVTTVGFAPVLDGREAAYSERWAACTVCAPYVKARDWDALVERVLDIEGPSPAFRPALRQAMLGLWRAAFEGQSQVVALDPSLFN